MSYQIITDSCCDFTEELYRQLDVAYAPLTVMYNGESHSNFTDHAAVKAFYDALRAGVRATTSAVNPEGWSRVMEPCLAKGRDVVVIAFSSALSTTYQSAVIAGNELKERYPERKIHIIDSLCAALGQGLLIWYACQKRDEGLDVDALAAWVEENKLHICHEVTVDDLDTLKRGGRISSTTALMGTMLNIKPMIHMDDEGRLINCAKVRGRKTAIDQIVKMFLKKRGSYANETVFIGHGDCPEDAAALEAMVKQHGVKTVVTGYVGPVIGAHTGPGVLVVFFMGEQR